MINLVLDTGFTRQDIPNPVVTMPNIGWDGIKMVYNNPEDIKSSAVSLAKIIEDNLETATTSGKCHNSAKNALKRMEAYYESIKGIDPYNIKLLTINLPVHNHFKMTSKQMSKSFKKTISNLRRYGAIQTACCVFEYSKDFKFHCHCIITINNMKKMMSELKKLRKKTSNKAYHICSHTNKYSLKNWMKYLMKDVAYMVSKVEIEKECGNYTFYDVLNYKPYIIKYDKSKIVDYTLTFKKGSNKLLKNL